GPDGTIWVTAPTGLTGGDYVWRSTDGGASFELLPVPDPVFGGGDSDLAIDPSGRIYQTGLWLGCVSAATSTTGDEWTMNPLMCEVPIDDRNWIEAADTGLAYLTFGSGQGALRSTALVRVEVVGDLPVAMNVLQIPDSGQYQWPGNLAVDKTTGNVYVAYLTRDDEAFVFRSTDGGQTAEKLPVAKRSGDTFDSFAVVATDVAGNLYFTWSEREKDTQTTGIYVTHSTDQGATWSTPQRVNTAATQTAIFPWIVAGDAGRLAVAYYATNATGPSAEEVDGTWHVHLATTENGLDANAPWLEQQISTTPIMQGSICTSGTGCAAGTRDLLDYFQIALDPQGYVHACWAEAPESGPTVLVYGRQTSGTSRYTANATPSNTTAEVEANLTSLLPIQVIQA
ncbi:MAG TPA: sialidase family protein, partial [Candidatus Thermoplasmatota archaeon]|nr:sialidase family protein [Candidatus Thermoplasmatota archaeon]